MNNQWVNDCRWCELLLVLAFVPSIAENSTATGSNRFVTDTTKQQIEQELDRMVITATRTPKKQENVPATVTVIHTEKIESTPAQTVGDLLGTLPGVKASEPQGVGMVTPQSLKIRGNGFPGHALILLDGQPINTPHTGFAYITTVPVRAVRRIEVVGGAYSALYGSSAGGGIVNISTKNGSDENYVEPWGSWGTFGRYDFGCDLGLSFGSFSLGAFYDHKNADNVYLYDDFGTDTVNYDHTHDRVHANLHYGPAENASLNLSGGFTRGETGSGLGSKLRLENHQNVMHPYVNLRGAIRPTDRFDLHAQVDWIRSHHEYYGETLDQIRHSQFGQPEFIYKASLNNTMADRIRVLCDASYSFTDDQVVTGGIEALRNSAIKEIRDANSDTLLSVQGRPGESGTESEYISSVFAQYDGTFLSRLELVIGGRLDYYDNWGLEPSPKAALRVRVLEDAGLLDVLDARFSTGRGFRAPSMSELYSPPWSIAPYIVYQGNADLLPEELWAFEGSLEGRFLDRRLFCRVAPYVTFAENLITSNRYLDPYNPLGQLMQPENVRKVSIKGVDAEMSAQIAFFDRIFVLTPFAVANFNRTVDDSTNQVIDGYPLYSGRAGLAPELSLGDFRIFGSWNTAYVGTYTSTSWGIPPQTDTVGGFLLHTAGAGVVWRDFITVSTDINNILNERSLIGIDSYLPERNVIGVLSVRMPLDGKKPWKN